MVYVNKYPEWVNICFLGVVRHGNMVKEDAGSDKCPSQLRIARELCLGLKLEVGE